MADPQIKINELTDYHLNDFIECPYSFRQKHLLKKNAYGWRDLVEHTVNQTISDFLTLPLSTRSMNSVLHSIHKHWIKNIDLFLSREHYFHVLGAMTSNLIRYLQKEQQTQSPLYLNTKMSVHIKERDLHLVLTLPLVLWDEESFSMKKVVVTSNPEWLRSWSLYTIFFCHQAFNQIPKRIEFFNVLTGAVESFLPQAKDLEIAQHYVSFLIETIQDPAVYQKVPTMLN